MSGSSNTTSSRTNNNTAKAGNKKKIPPASSQPDKPTVTRSSPRLESPPKQQKAVPPQSPKRTSRKAFTTDAMIIGSSIVRHVKGGTVKNYTNQRTKVCCFPGAGYEKIADHAEVEVKYCVPKVAILHAGGNDLANKISGDEITENLAFLGCELLNRGVKRIAISGMTPRKGMKNEITDLNKQLVSMCRTYGYDYIDNSNIWFSRHLAWDNVHLNYDGVEILESNFIDYLNDVDLEE